MDAHKNFAYSTVAAAPSPGLSGVTLTVQSGDGAKFAAAPFNVVVCPFNTFPLVSNAEIARVTSIVGDVFTIVRQQESGPNRSIVVGDQIFMAATAKTFTDIETLYATLASPALTGVPTAPTAAPGTSTTQLATTAFATAADILLAPLASPTFTGTPAAPTAAVGTSSTQLATTAFVAANAPTIGSTLPTTTGNIPAEPIPSGAGVLSTFHNNASLKTIQGMVAGTHGQLWFHYSVGAGQVNFAHLNGSGTALGKCRNFSTSGPTSLVVNGVAVYQYDNGVVSGATAGWRLVYHEQGTWVPVPFVAGNFTGNGAMTWTVTLGNISRNSYKLDGKTLSWAFDVGVTTIGGTPDISLQIATPAGFTVAGATAGPFSFINGNGVSGSGTWAATGSLILFRVDRSSAVNWSAGANAIVTGVATFEVN